MRRSGLFGAFVAGSCIKNVRVPTTVSSVGTTTSSVFFQSVRAKSTQSLPYLNALPMKPVAMPGTDRTGCVVSIASEHHAAFVAWCREKDVFAMPSSTSKDEVTLIFNGSYEDLQRQLFGPSSPAMGR